MSRTARIAGALFLGVAILLLVFHGNRVVSTNDEGILLEPAQRVAAGARPYVDFWAYMSPGSYWLQAAAFRAFGVSLLTGRLIVILDFSLQCALVFWLTARLTSVRAAVVVLFAFAGFQMADPSFLTAQHRWDSATLALAGIAIAISATSRVKWAASGALLAAAAWCTPTVALVGAAQALWLGASRERRKALLPWTVGVAATSALAIGWLVAKGCLHAFLEQLLWLKQNYSGINIMPYGTIIGGYRALFEGSNGFSELAVRGILVGCVALPAILPPVALLGWAVAFWRRKVPDGQRSTVQLLLLGLAALVMTLFPRADVMHLAFIAALSYVLAGSALALLIPARARGALAICALIMASVFASNFFISLRGTTAVASPVGTLRVSRGEHTAMENLLASVRPGEGLFVYPYMPIDYFLTQATNPTRFAFLNPGMSTSRDAGAALQDLQARPPQWLLYLKLSREEFLRIFPHGSNLDWRYETLEDWLDRNYQPVKNPEVTVSGYQLWQRTDRSEAKRR
jgi:hypothetical protein